MFFKEKSIFIFIVLVLFALLIVPIQAGDIFVSNAILIFFYIAITELWNFMSAHVALVSLGSQMFIAIGAYTTAIAMMRYGVPFLASILLAGLVSSFLAAIFCFPLLRMRGVYFAIATLLVSELLSRCFSAWDYVGGGAGITMRGAFYVSRMSLYYVALCLSIISILSVYFIYKSKIGYALRAIGCDWEAASELGVDEFKYKSICFILASFLMGMTGSVYIQYTGYIDPICGFSLAWTTNIAFIVILGGYGRLVGPIIGSILFVLLLNFLAGYIGLTLILEGIIIVALLFFFPDGIWGWIARKRYIKSPI